MLFHSHFLLTGALLYQTVLCTDDPGFVYGSDEDRHRYNAGRTVSVGYVKTPEVTVLRVELTYIAVSFQWLCTLRSMGAPPHPDIREPSYPITYNSAKLLSMPLTFPNASFPPTTT
jgi:hypothetical protein